MVDARRTTRLRDNTPPTNQTVFDEARVTLQDNNQQSTNVVDDTDTSWEFDTIALATADML